MVDPDRTGRRDADPPQRSGGASEPPVRRPGGRTLPVALSLIPAVLLVVAFVALVVVSDAFRAEMATVWSLLLDGEPEPLRVWLLGFGAWAPLVSALLQIATSVFPPGPSFLLSIANAMLYGALLGGLLTFVTALGAAALCFAIARVIGRPGVERLVSEESLERADRFMEKRGLLTVFLARLIPFINPDVVSYAAGVTGIRWVPFLAAMSAGQLPATIFYSVIGAAAVESTLWIAALVGVGTFLPLVFLWIFRERIAGWRRGDGADGRSDG